MCHRRRPIAHRTTPTGIPKLLRHQDCEYKCVSTPECDADSRFTYVCSYVLSLVLKRIFMLKCNLAMLRLTPMLTLVSLPIALTRLLCYYKRERPPPSLTIPVPEAVVVSAFPIAWFFGFLYYTEVPSLVFVVLTVVAAMQNKHALAALVRHGSSSYP